MHLLKKISVFLKHTGACSAVVAALLSAVLMSTGNAQEARREMTPTERRWNELARVIFGRERRMPRSKACADAGLGRAKLALEKALLLARSSYAQEKAIERELDIAARYVEDPKSLEPRDITGFHELAYVSDIDLSPQPYLLYVPTTYDGRTPMPLIVFLHGYAWDLSKTNWIEYMYSPSLQNVCEKLGFVLALPYGRSNTEFMGIGESDVLHVIDLVKKRVRIDDARVVISGASMGGSGAYSIACHRPHLFAGIFAVTGRVDYFTWMNAPKEKFPRFKQVQVDTDYARDLLGNLLHIPVFIGHGRLDALLDVKQSRLMARLMKERNLTVDYVEFPNGSHYIWSDVFEHPTLNAALQKWRRPEPPAKIQYRTYTMKYPRAYWVTIEEMETWGRPADVAAEIKSAKRIQVETENITALILDLSKGIEPGVEVVWNGKDVDASAIERKAPDGFRVRLGERTEGMPLRKTPQICGPVREAYDGPFLIVTPTLGGAAAMRDAVMSRKVATEWRVFAQAIPHFMQDVAVTDEHIRDFNLILCGGPETNAVLARIADRLPIRIESDAYVVGKRRFPREGNGLLMIYPNPLNPKRYVLIREELLWGESLEANHKLDLVPDFIIYTPDIDRDGSRYETNQYLCAGYFDSFWRLSEASTWANRTMNDER